MCASQSDLTCSTTDVNQENKKVKKLKYKCGTLVTKQNIYIVVYTICLIGCLYQMILLLLSYLDYETSTDLRIERTKRIHPPALSICLPYFSLLNLTDLFNKYPYLKKTALNYAKNYPQLQLNETNINEFRLSIKEKTFDSKFGDYLLKELTLREIFNSTIQFNQLFINCEYKSPKTYLAVETKNLAQCLSVWSFEEYIKDQNKCFMFAYKDIVNRSYVFNLERLANSFFDMKLLMSIKLNTTIIGEHTHKAELIFHPKYRLPRGRSDFSLTIENPAKNYIYHITYAHTKATLLEKPYETNCKLYQPLGFDSRNECVDNCTIVRSMEKYGKAPFNVLFAKDANIKILTQKDIHRNETLALDLEEIYVECLEVCHQPDCTKDHYPPQLISETKMDKDENEKGLLLIIEIPSTLDIRTKQTIRLSFLDYIVQTTAVFGFWFGLCILQIADLIEYIKKKRKQTKRLTKKLTHRKVDDSKV